MHRRGAASAFVIVLAAAGLFAPAGSARPTIDSTLATEPGSPVTIASLMRPTGAQVRSSRQAPRGPGHIPDVLAPRAPTGSGAGTQNHGGCVPFNTSPNPYLYSPGHATGRILAGKTTGESCGTRGTGAITQLSRRMSSLGARYLGGTGTVRTSSRRGVSTTTPITQSGDSSVEGIRDGRALMGVRQSEGDTLECPPSSR